MPPIVAIHFIIVSTALWIVACSPLSALNAVVSNEAYTRTADLSYGPLSRQKLDVYLPVKRSGEAPPVVIFFYGGNWESGDRKDYRFVAEALTSHGIVTVLPDYRVYPEVLFPEFVKDGAAATRWVKDNIARFGADPKRIFLMGHSAGAHIAAMLALDFAYFAENGLAPAVLAGMIGLAGPYDFLPLKSATLKVIFGPETERWRSQPINYVDGRNPPLLLLTGTDDTTVDPGNAERLADKVRAHNGPAQVRTFSDMGHVGILTRLAAPLQGDGEVLQAVVRFVHQR